MSQVQSTELIRLISNGDHTAWEEFYRQHKPIVHSWCRQMTHNSADADDLTQEVFLRTFLRISTFRGTAKLRTWLYRVTLNCVLMQRRKPQRREVACERAIPTNQGVVSVTPELRQTVSAPNINWLMLQETIERLPQGRRTVFLLHDVLGFTHTEISQKLCLSTENSKCRLRRARFELREDLTS